MAAAKDPGLRESQLQLALMAPPVYLVPSVPRAAYWNHPELGQKALRPTVHLRKVSLPEGVDRLSMVCLDFRPVRLGWGSLSLDSE